MTATDDDDPMKPEPVFNRIQTSDPELAAEVLRNRYQLSNVRISGDTEGFRLRQEVLASRTFAVTRFQTTVEVGYRGPLDGLLCVDHVHAGRLSFDTARDELRTGPGEICLVPPEGPWRATTEEIDVAPLTLDRTQVAAHAAEISGIEPDGLVFTGHEPICPAAARRWTTAVAHVRDHVLGNPEAAAQPLIQAEALRLLSTGLLTTFPNNAMDALADRPAPRTMHTEPKVLRLALEFIDANADRPIGMGEISEAARISPRSLQYAFRRHRDSAPLEYLKRVRLERVHRDLQAGDPTRGDTVAKIAARWGFSHTGRFAVEYRRRYGCSPNQTLR